MRWLCLAAAALLYAGPAAAAEFPLARDTTVVGNLREYTVQSGDNLADVARKFDVGYTEMLAANPGVDPWSPQAGRTLTVPSLFILPDAPRQGIVINLGERRIYYYPPGGRTVETYPIGIGAIGFDTPLSTTKVVRKEPNPVWIPPASIHAENPDVPDRIGPGPDNPLGAFALRLGWTNYLIHGTNKPDGVGRNVSHGCIHLYPEDIEALFKMVPVGTPVRAVDQPAAAAWIAIGLYVEVHPSKDQADQIDMEQPVAPAALPALRDQIAAVARDQWGDVDWRTVDQATQSRTGLPVEVAMRAPAGGAAADQTSAVTPPAPITQPDPNARAVDPNQPPGDQQSAVPMQPMPPAVPQPAQPTAPSLTPIFGTLQPPADAAGPVPPQQPPVYGAAPVAPPQPLFDPAALRDPAGNTAQPPAPDQPVPAPPDDPYRR